MIGSESRRLKMAILTLSVVIIAVSTNKEPNANLRVVADAGPIDEPRLRERENAGTFT